MLDLVINLDACQEVNGSPAMSLDKTMVCIVFNRSLAKCQFLWHGLCMECTLGRQLRADTELCGNQTSTYWTRLKHTAILLLNFCLHNSGKKGIWAPPEFQYWRHLWNGSLVCVGQATKIVSDGNWANWNWCLFPKSFIKWLSSSEGLSKSNELPSSHRRI